MAAPRALTEPLAGIDVHVLGNKEGEVAIEVVDCDRDAAVFYVELGSTEAALDLARALIDVVRQIEVSALDESIAQSVGL